MFAAVTNGPFDLESVSLKDPEVSSTYAKPREGLDAQHLSKVGVLTSQRQEEPWRSPPSTRFKTDDQKLARNYGTNDRMLRYKRIHRYFFMDTFFASKKHGPSSICDRHRFCGAHESEVRSFGCCQAICKRSWGTRRHHC